MPEAKFSGIDPLGCNGFVESVSGMPWESPSIHKMNLMQSKTGVVAGSQETVVNISTGGSKFYATPGIGS